ncbi:hypothetical protein [Leptospira ilyithenensis]|uniref:Lipoprotein n=1 Tax=Leptospira ilyithenensis TaxID=2484901 RepID=A0A4R9LRK8_9LEPT|nr:hypothetical protein [Leptospira ilyithenensis]TGN13384.1 hypothetical protein EHS11_03900 [Leptospira ilyithenensis]
MYIKIFTMLSLISTFSCSSLNRRTITAADLLGVNDPIKFDNSLFFLVWAAKPQPNYTKQEYLPKGETLDRYSRMILIENFNGKITPENAVASKVNELQQRKSFDPTVNFEIIKSESTSEYAIDFIIWSEKQNIVEWNIYRYRPTKSGIALFGLSLRAYDYDQKKFLSNLRFTRIKYIVEFSKSEFPIIN